jgi:hypothetical protein
MDYVMMGSAVVDLLAVGILGAMLARSARERDTTLVDQRQTMERLRGDIAQLLEDAGERARGLEQSLVARERALRALLGELERVEARRAPQAAAAPSLALGERERPLATDPAEARLLRDLELRFAEQER